MWLHPFKFGVPLVLLGQPFLYLTIMAKDQSPWLVAIGVYLFSGFLVGTWYLPFAYRLSALVFWKWLLLSAGVALFSAALYALIMSGSLDVLFVQKQGH